MKNLIIVFFLLYTVLISSQEIQFVNAHSGLIIRENPRKNSKRIGKLKYGVRVYILKETGIEIHVEDDGETIRGQWVEIQEVEGNQKGFVFNGYLTVHELNKGDETGNYYLTKIDSTIIKKYWEDLFNMIDPKPTSVYLRNKKNENLFEISISELESYENTSLTARDTQSLNNVTEIVTIELTYNSCCSNHYYTYFLKTTNGKLIKLPEIENTHCDGPEPYFEYLFPDQEYGESNKIIFAKLFLDENYNVSSVEIQKTYSWNGTEFNLEN